MTAASPQVIGPRFIAPAIGAIPATAAAVGAALPAAITAPIATVIGAVAPLTIFAAPAVLPFLIGSLFGSSPEELAASQFRLQSAIPGGIDFNAVFGISHLGGRPSAEPITDVGSLAGIDRSLRVGGAIPFGPLNPETTIGFHIRNSFSFVPEVAAAGRAKIAEFLNQPFVPARSGIFARRAGIGALGNQQAIQEQVFENRKREIFDEALGKATTLVRNDPFFSAVAQASRFGLLPGTELSERARDLVLPEIGNLGLFFFRDSPHSPPTRDDSRANSAGPNGFSVRRSRRTYPHFSNYDGGSTDAGSIN